MTRGDALALFEKSVERSGWSPERLAWRVADTLRGVDWLGKDVCEFGCGAGDLSYYLALHGARSVVAVDPATRGCSSARSSMLASRLQAIPLDRLTFLPTRIEDAPLAPGSFDVAFGVQVIEHIFETEGSLAEHPEALAAYRRFFEIAHSLLRPGGSLVLTDHSPRTIWSKLPRLGIPPLPGTESVHWPIHREPGVYSKIARRAGFAEVRVHWRVPYRLRGVRAVADNRLFHLLTWGSYILLARR